MNFKRDPPATFRSTHWGRTPRSPRLLSDRRTWLTQTARHRVAVLPTSSGQMTAWTLFGLASAPRDSGRCRTSVQPGLHQLIKSDTELKLLFGGQWVHPVLDADLISNSDLNPGSLPVRPWFLVCRFS
jgi:hypothetical protein